METTFILASITKRIAENLLDLVRVITDNGVPEVVFGKNSRKTGVRGWSFKKKRASLDPILIFIKMKFHDNYAADGVYVAGSKLCQHDLQIRRFL